MNLGIRNVKKQILEKRKYFREWEKRLLKLKASKVEPAQIAPSICFSRKIGAGALEIAVTLAKKLNFRLADR